MSRENQSPSAFYRVPPCGRTPSKETHPPGDSRKLLKTITQKLHDFVTEKKLNRSKARDLILQVIVEEARHFRAQDLVDKLHARFHDEVGRSTVYRNLPILVECGLIREGPRGPDGEALYELSEEEHHDHIVCLDCGHIFEFHDDSIENRQGRIAKNQNFTVRDHRHVVYASCDRLAKAKKRVKS